MPAVMQGKPPAGPAGGLQEKRNEMTHALSEPVNLIGEIDEYSSQPCLRRVMARILGHAGLALAEAQEIWRLAGYPSEHWDGCVRIIQAM